MTEQKATLSKNERACSRSTISKLFESGSKSFSIFPIRTVFMPVKRENEANVSILVSVPKRHFKRAVKRNRVKRQIREAFRKNKQLIYSAICEKNYNIVIAFIWLDKELHQSEEIERKMIAALSRIAEKCNHLVAFSETPTSDSML